MERVYKITKLGRRILRDSSLPSEELGILQYLKDNKSASSSQIEIAGGERWMVRSLQRRKFIKEISD